MASDNANSNNVPASPLKFVEEPNSHLKCPICKKCYRDPVINGNVSCGHTFCKRCAENLETCPIDSSLCDVNKLVVNRLVVGQIDDLLIYCPYGLIQQNNEWVVDHRGCPDKILLGSLEEHKKDCRFVLVLCPNSSECGTFYSQDLSGHLELCCHQPCPNYANGCDYKGNSSSIQTHLQACSFTSAESHSSIEHITRICSLEKSNLSLQKDVSFLKDKIISLESSKDELSCQLSNCIGSINSLQQKFDHLHSMLEQSTNTPKRNSYGPKTDSTTASQKSLSNPFSSPTSSPTNSSKVEQWEMPFQFKCIGTLRGHQDVVWCLTVYHGKLFSAGSDANVKVWDLETLAKGCIGNLHGHNKRIHCSCVGGGYLYTAGDDLSIKQWNVTAGSQTLVVENAHDNTICSILVNSDNLFTSSFSLIKVWNSKNITLKHSISGLQHWVRALALSPNKEWLYSGSHNAINVWDTSTFEVVDQIAHKLGSVYSLVVTRQYVIAGTYDQNIQLFDARTKEAVIKLEGHFGAITSLVASPSGKFLFSGSHDHNVQMWNLEKHLPIQTLLRHQGSVNSIALYGNMLLSGSEDTEIKVYRYFQSPL